MLLLIDNILEYDNITIDCSLIMNRRCAMYIDSLTITAFVVFAVAMVMFIKKCIINGCVMSRDNKAGAGHDVEPGDEQ